MTADIFLRPTRPCHYLLSFQPLRLFQTWFTSNVNNWCQFFLLWAFCHGPSRRASRYFYAVSGETTLHRRELEGNEPIIL